MKEPQGLPSTGARHVSSTNPFRQSIIMSATEEPMTSTQDVMAALESSHTSAALDAPFSDIQGRLDTVAPSSSCGKPKAPNANPFHPPSPARGEEKLPSYKEVVKGETSGSRSPTSQKQQLEKHYRQQDAAARPPRTELGSRPNGRPPVNSGKGDFREHRRGPIDSRDFREPREPRGLRDPLSRPGERRPPRDPFVESHRERRHHARREPHDRDRLREPRIRREHKSTVEEARHGEKEGIRYVRSHEYGERIKEPREVRYGSSKSGAPREVRSERRMRHRSRYVDDDDDDDDDICTQSPQRRSSRRPYRARSKSAPLNPSVGLEGLPLDLIDKMDVTGLFGPGRFHHDGPFDACNPHRNKDKSNAPVKAFDLAGPNNSLSVVDPEYSRYMQEETVYGRHSSVAGGPALLSEHPDDTFSATDDNKPLHGRFTAGLGTSTFLDGTPASRDAIAEADRAQLARSSQLGRGKSILRRRNTVGRQLASPNVSFEETKEKCSDTEDTPSPTEKPLGLLGRVRSLRVSRR